MALFKECMQSCAHTVLDTADIVRDGDFSTIVERSRYNRGHVLVEIAREMQCFVEVEHWLMFSVAV
jgi:hypothetical protein